MEQKFCKDCQHFLPSKLVPDDLKMGRCARNPTFNLVDGSPEYRFAENERTDSRENSCGTEGKYFKLMKFLEIHDHRDNSSTPNHDLDRYGRPLKEGT